MHSHHRESPSPPASSAHTPPDRAADSATREVFGDRGSDAL